MSLAFGADTWMSLRPRRLMFLPPGHWMSWAPYAGETDVPWLRATVLSWLRGDWMPLRPRLLDVLGSGGDWNYWPALGKTDCSWPCGAT